MVALNTITLIPLPIDTKYLFFLARCLINNYRYKLHVYKMNTLFTKCTKLDLYLKHTCRDEQKYYKFRRKKWEKKWDAWWIFWKTDLYPGDVRIKSTNLLDLNYINLSNRYYNLIYKDISCIAQAIEKDKKFIPLPQCFLHVILKITYVWCYVSWQLKTNPTMSYRWMLMLDLIAHE